MGDSTPPARSRIPLRDVRDRGQRHAHLANDPAYARLIVRHASPLVTYLVVNFTRLGADAITALSILSGVVGGLLTAIPSPGTNVASVLLLQLAYLLDVADGEVARVRGTAGLRGTYLDLVGHVVQNRALYAGSAMVLVGLTSASWWSIAIALIGVAFASPFGELARMQVTGARAQGDHAAGRGSANGSTAGGLYAAYRRAAFVWNYPASMNLFCIALLADAARSAVDGSAGPLVLPVFASVFIVTLAIKQFGNAARLLGRGPWSTA